ncbi:hypothetical protein H8E88_21135 [candidate division KSB1 bacterium]|nr:hypothetical protein [candidate division KSB1 bacterium]
MKKLKWYRQEKPYSCIPACIRMILDYHDIIESESTLRFKCKSKISGTHPLNAVACCKSYGLDCYIDNLDLTHLKNLLNDDILPIVNVLKSEAANWYSHCVIISNIEHEQIAIVDPEDGFHKFPIIKFDELWSFSNRLAIIVKEK